MNKLFLSICLLLATFTGWGQTVSSLPNTNVIKAGDLLYLVVTNAGLGTHTSYNVTYNSLLTNLLSSGNFVVGPASANDESLAVYDGPTGKLIKSSVVFLSGFNMSGLGSITSSNGFFNTGIYVDGGITNSVLTPNELVYADANNRLTSASVGVGLSFSGGVLSATGSAAANSGTIVTQSVVVITNQYTTTGFVLSTATNAAVGDGFPVITNSFKPMYSTNRLRFVFTSTVSRSAIGTPGAIVADGYTNYWQNQVGTIHANSYILQTTIIVENVPVLQTATNQEFTVRYWQDGAGTLAIGRSTASGNAFAQTSFRVEEYIP